MSFISILYFLEQVEDFNIIVTLSDKYKIYNNFHSQA